MSDIQTRLRRLLDDMSSEISPAGLPATARRRIRRGRAAAITSVVAAVAVLATGSIVVARRLTEGPVVPPAASCTSGWEVAGAAPLRGGPRFVKTFAENDLWVLSDGAYRENGKMRPGAYHWDGTSWTLTKTPFAGEDGKTIGFDGASSRDLWLASWVKPPGATGPNPTLLPTLVHWDGTAWSRVTPPQGLGLPSALHAGNGSVWVAGSGSDGVPMLWRRSGNAWTRVPLPAMSAGATVRQIATDPQGNVYVLTSSTAGSAVIVRPSGPEGSWMNIQGAENEGFVVSIAAVSAGSVWMAGKETATNGPGMMMRWDGNVLRRVPIDDDDLVMVAHVAAKESTAVGTGYRYAEPPPLGPFTAEQGLAARDRPALLRLDGSKFTSSGAPVEGAILLQDIDVAADGTTIAVGTGPRADGTYGPIVLRDC